MSDVTELLEKYYQSFITEEYASDFFLGLADYLQFAYQNPACRAALEKLKEQQSVEYTKLKVLEDKALKELDAAEKILRKIQSKQTLDSELTTELFKAYQDYKSQKIISSATRPVEMNRVLFETAVEISKKDPGYVRQFIDLNPAHPNVYGNYKFSDALEQYLEQKEHIRQSKKRELWATLYYLTVMVMVLMKGKPEFDAMYTYEGKPEAQLTDEGADYFHTQGDWDRLKHARITLQDWEELLRTTTTKSLRN